MATMQKTEDQHHTPEQVEAYAREACDIADRIGLDAEDRAAVLPVLVTLLASKQLFYEQQAPLPAFDLGKFRGHS